MHVREVFLERLKEDLIGPSSADEILNARPSDVYLTGILWPHETRMEEEEDESLDMSGMEEAETSGGGEEEISFGSQARPCVAGVSFATRAEQGIPELNVKVQFATYEPVTVDEPESEADKAENDATLKRKKKLTKWRRCAHKVVKELALENATTCSRLIALGSDGVLSGIKLHLRTAPWEGRTLATVTLLNGTTPNVSKGREEVERLTLFQVTLEIYPQAGTELVARPSRRVEHDEDDRSATLLYRDVREFATGHMCSVKWEAKPGSEVADMVGTNWVPTAVVSDFSADGHEVFQELRRMSQCKPLSAQWIGTSNSDELGHTLQQFPAAYKTWIDCKEGKVPSLPKEFQDQAAKNLSDCRKVHDRIVAGTACIANDPKMLRAFRLANLAMNIQHGWGCEGSEPSPLEWRPFQLGFILLVAASVVDREHLDRGIMDMLWFPTGGGKTEAYLALVAFLAFYRRLSFGGDGVAAVMRYTLRLLTTQQFVRATSVMLACEMIRRGHICEANVSHSELGDTPFSIGLWVGGGATPNKVSDAADALKGVRGQPTPQQLEKCPVCRKKQLTCKHDRKLGAIFVYCENKCCQLFDPQTPLPVWTVDEDVYRERPTLLIGTIDKFAQIVRQKKVNSLFGIDSGHPPDLIIQDELHLISGPLGTIAGLYEAAIDRLFTVGNYRPKIIGSTATIRRAPEQVRALFNRQTAQFPPQGLDADDSAFAVRDPDSPDRRYVGLTTAGRSAKFTLQAVAASLLQSGIGATEKDTERDPYWTLVSYFNSLRELGGALVLMQDDVNDSLSRFAKRRRENVRHPEFIEELTSRRTQAGVRDMLGQLDVSVETQEALDIVLATNMFSVGVDIPRLGLMLVNGQPKGTAEYIQATSRVGRGNVHGLIVAVLNNAKARDRSYYECFPAWHQTLYRDVEPTSVTPFASRARDRALHAVLVALVRHLVQGMLENPYLSEEAAQATKYLIEDIVKRAKVVDPEEHAVERELNRKLEIWRDRQPQSYWKQKKKERIFLLQDAERVAALRAMGRLPDEAWPTLNSMRSVEASTRFRLAERLTSQADEDDSNGK